MTDKLVPRLKDKKNGRFRKGNESQMTAGHSHFIANGSVPASTRGRRRINRYLSKLSRDLVDACGGAEKMNVRRELMVRQVLRSEGVLTLIEAYLMKSGITKPGNLELVPMLQSSYLSFMRTQQSAIMNLTSLLQEKDNGNGAPDPFEVARTIDLEKEERARAVAEAAGAGGPGIAQEGRTPVDEGQRLGKDAYGGGDD